MMNRVQSLGLIVGCVLATISLGGAVGPSKPVGAVALAPTALLYGPTRYGTVYIYPTLTSDWDPGDIGAMEEALSGVKDLGLDTIIQTFPAGLVGSGNESRWRLFLDAAQTVGIDVVAYLSPNNVYPTPGAPFYYEDLKAFLDVVGDHPALIGYVGLHEPLEPTEGISEDELKAFYTEMKNYAPNLKIAHYMGNIAYWDENREDWAFSDGVCDICIIYYFPFRYVSGEPVYDRDIVLSVVQSNVPLVQERDPDAELWFFGQAFAQSAHWQNLRMPTPDEMVALYLDVMHEPVDGFMWYPWCHTDIYDSSLGDEGMEEQQEAVKDIADNYTPPKIYLPLIIKFG